MESAKRVDKPCEDCGALLVNVVSTRKFCYECARKRQRANKKQYNTVKQKKQKVVLRGTPIQNNNAKYCKGCFYWGGHDESACCCNYLLITDKRRPCPPGKYCTVRKQKRRKETK